MPRFHKCIACATEQETMRGVSIVSQHFFQAAQMIASVAACLASLQLGIAKFGYSGPAGGFE